MNSLQTVVVVRGGTDRYGNPQPGAEHPIEGCTVSPVATATGPGGTVSWSTTDFSLLPPPGADIRQGDQVRLEDGSLWKVEGVPFEWGNPLTGTSFGGEVQIVRVS